MIGRAPSFTAVLLAAGRGSRMAGHTEERPKCLLEVGGRALLDWQIEALREAGAAEIAIVTGYRRDMLAGRGLVEFHNPRWADTNMVSSLACAAEWLERGPVLVSYSDLLYEGPALAPITTTPAPLAIFYDPDWEALWTRRFGDPLLDAETFRLNGDGTMAEIGGKPSTVAEIQGQYMGLLRFTPHGWNVARELWMSVRPGQRDRVHMTGFLQLLIESGRLPIRAIPYAGRWGEFDSPADLAALGPIWTAPKEDA